MADGSRIEWTDATWNPVTGCTKISAGCKNCYAERMAKRLQAMGSPPYVNAFKLTLQPQTLAKPFSWRNPRKVFVNSMSDLFHKDVPLEYIQRVFDVMERASIHTFQVLTKRPEIALEYASRLPWPKNVWLGTSVENMLVQHRVTTLSEIPAQVRFISAEPLIGPLPKLELSNIHWVIVGGESGPGSREIKPEWVRQIREQCLANNVSFFFKQWGGVNKKRSGRILDGMTWDGMPTEQEDGTGGYCRASQG